MKLSEILFNDVQTADLAEDQSNFGPRDPVFAARMKIKDLAKELKIASGDLMLRYGRQLNRVENNPQRALNYLELAMKLPRGRLKGFDKLYTQVTTKPTEH